MDILLIHPPVSRPCEPPAGLARLAGALADHGRACLIVDADIEGVLYLLGATNTAEDTWTRRALRHREKNLTGLREKDTYRNPGRYTRSVADLNRILAVVSAQFHTQVSLGNYSQGSLTPVKSTDLIRSAEHPEANVFYPYFAGRFSALLEEHAPRLIGFSLNYLSQALTCFAMIGFIRRMNPGVKIVLGGGLVTSWIRSPHWQNPFSGLVDELVAGPGEERIVRLAGAEYSGKVPLPDYSPFHDNAYLSPDRVIPLSTSSGCYWGRCSFCPEKAEGTPYSCIPTTRVLSEIDTLVEKESPGLVHLCDNALSPALLTSLALGSMKAPWYGFARITPHLTDGDFCQALKKSGCVMLKLGLESGDQGVLDELGKGIMLEVASGALRELKRAGIATYVYLLFGTPAEDLSAARKTMEFVISHSSLIDFLNLSIFNLPRGSIEANDLSTFDFSDGDLSLNLGFNHPKAWDRNHVRQFLDKEFKRQPLVARIIRNDPPVFTSNHAPFFVMNRPS